MIDIQHVTVHLPGFNLKDITLTVKEHDFFMLMGPTGAGKTVLLESIAGLVPISSGKMCCMARTSPGCHRKNGGGWELSIRIMPCFLT